MRLLGDKPPKIKPPLFLNRRDSPNSKLPSYCQIGSEKEGPPLFPGLEALELLVSCGLSQELTKE